MHLSPVRLNIAFSTASSSSNNNHNDLSAIAHDYFSVYSQHFDFERLMSFYDSNAQFEDIIYGNDLKNKKEIKEFLAWDRGEFKILSNGRALTVTKQLFKKKLS